MNTPLTPLEPVLRALHLHADRTALRCGDVTLSYAELARRTAQMVTLLREAGLRPGGHVALVSPNTLDALIAFHAVPLAGGVIVPLNTAFDDHDLNFLLRHADPVGVFVDRAQLPRVAHTIEALRLPYRATGPDAALAAELDTHAPAELRLPEGLKEDQPISVNYTSGTTSDPKGVMLTHRNMHTSLCNLLYHLNLRPGHAHLHALTLSHSNGWGMAWAVTAAGAEHVLPTRPQPLGAADLRAELAAVTHLTATPALLAPLADMPQAAPLTRPVRVLLAGTTPTLPLITGLQAQGFEVLHGYGLTETSAVLTVTDLGAQPGADAALLRRQGHAMLHGGEIQVVLEDGTPVPADGRTPGEVVIRSNQVMKGYYKNPRATRRAIKNGWLHTGDLAVLHPDHRLEILDREGDLLKLAGHPMSSVQIEAVLYRHPSVREAVVVAAPGEDGDQPVAFLTLHPGAQVTGREILGFCTPHLPAYALPRRAVITTDLPKTASGKVLKHVLRAEVKDKRLGHSAD